MPSVKIKQLRDSASTETRAAERKTGWFPVTDLAKNVFIRKINARYSSGDDITVTVYSDGDTDNQLFAGTLRANSGETGATLSSGVNSTVTTLPTSSTTKLKSGDWIKVSSEIMKVITAGTTSHTVQRGMRGTSAEVHSADKKIYYSNYPNDSLRIGRRAKYAMVKLSSSESANDIEINKLEIEHR